MRTMASTTRRDTLYPQILLWILLHYLAYIVMQTLALLAEVRRGSTLPDLILEQIPVHRSLFWIDSSLWLPLLLLFILILALVEPVACVNYLRVGAATSLLRGIFISLTSMGPPMALAKSSPAAILHLHYSDITPALLLHQWWPVDVFWGGSGLSAVYLTQDLFFSGHTSTTFLLLLVVLPKSNMYKIFLVFHVITVLGLLVTHEHYSIDILGAYFVVYATWHFFQRRGWLRGATSFEG